MSVAPEISRFRKAEAVFRPLGLDNRAINALVRGGVCSLEDLARLTERRAKAIPGLGLKTIGQLKTYLKADEQAETAPWEDRTIATRFNAKTLAEIDSWLRTQAAVSSRPIAIRYLVEQGLKAALKVG
ncbi:MAG: hypothetical protein JO256_06430 [Alphaproteobacteria bacterium]|nr:hypothetical protein [Alphaproteobacteria bacterium]